MKSEQIATVRRACSELLIQHASSIRFRIAASGYPGTCKPLRVPEL